MILMGGNLMKTVIESLKQQVAEEIVEDELSKDKKQMILQKYGIMNPQLTAAERHIILKELRRTGATA